MAPAAVIMVLPARKYTVTSVAASEHWEKNLDSQTG